MIENAGEHNSEEVIYYLLEDAPISISVNKRLNQAIINAVSNGNIKLTKYLVQKSSSDIQDFDNTNKIFMIENSLASGNLELFRYLAKHYSLLNVSDHEIDRAADCGDREFSELIIEHFDIDISSSLLKGAIRSGNLDLIRYLIEEVGADLDNCTGRYDPALMAAVENNYPEVVYYIMSKIDIDLKLYTLPECAYQNGNYELGEFLEFREKLSSTDDSDSSDSSDESF